MDPISRLYPFLSVRDVGAAVDFYREAFGATEVAERLEAPDGTAVAQLDIDGRPLGVASERLDLGNPSPGTAGGTTVRVSIHVADPDAAQARAVAAGAREVFPVADPTVLDAAGPRDRPARAPLADRPAAEPGGRRWLTSCRS